MHIPHELASLESEYEMALIFYMFACMLCALKVCRKSGLTEFIVFKTYLFIYQLFKRCTTLSVCLPVGILFQYYFLLQPLQLLYNNEHRKNIILINNFRRFKRCFTELCRYRQKTFCARDVILHNEGVVDYSGSDFSYCIK